LENIFQWSIAGAAMRQTSVKLQEYLIRYGRGGGEYSWIMSDQGRARVGATAHLCEIVFS